MTTLTDTQVITASGGLVELGYTAVTTPVTITSTTAGSGDLVASVSAVCDGSPIVLDFSATCQVGSGNQINVSLHRDGSEVQRFWMLEYASGAAAAQTTLCKQYRDTPSAGVHTYEVRAWRSNTNGTTQVYAGGGGTSSPPFFVRVSKVVQATQWPAVTTGTIICTSSTRPASPFAGQSIYETDTSLSYTYSGSAWVPTGDLGAWETYVPTWTGVTTTGATILGYYTKMGRTVHFWAQFTLGTGSAVAGPVTVTLPFTAARNASGLYNAYLNDNGVNTFLGYGACLGSSTTLTIAVPNVGATYPTLTNLTSTIPFTWGIPDAITVSGTYEAAS